LPVIGLANGGSADGDAHRVRALRKGLSETGYVEGRNVAIEYRWLEGQYKPMLLRSFASNIAVTWAITWAIAWAIA
jgi:hypothetical protein